MIVEDLLIRFLIEEEKKSKVVKLGFKFNMTPLLDGTGEEYIKRFNEKLSQNLKDFIPKAKELVKYNTVVRDMDCASRRQVGISEKPSFQSCEVEIDCLTVNSFYFCTYDGCGYKVEEKFFFDIKIQLNAE